MKTQSGAEKGAAREACAAYADRTVVLWDMSQGQPVPPSRRTHRLYFSRIFHNEDSRRIYDYIAKIVSCLQ